MRGARTGTIPSRQSKSARSATNAPERIEIAQVIESEAGAQHGPGGKEENVRTFERMQVLVEMPKS